MTNCLVRKTTHRRGRIVDSGGSKQANGPFGRASGGVSGVFLRTPPQGWWLVEKLNREEMARLDAHTEYIITQADYRAARASLPQTGVEGQTAQSVSVTARQYRQNTSQTINAGKWVMWGIAPESFDFMWSDGDWQPPANLVVRPD